MAQLVDSQADMQESTHADDSRSPAGARLSPAIIAIDGPAASGKSTIGQRLAEALNYLFFDTGVMYRAVTWAALERGLDVRDRDTVGELAESIVIDVAPLEGADGVGRGSSRVLVDGRDVTAFIRTDHVDRSVSAVSAHGRVRAALGRQQRRVAAEYGTGEREKMGIVMVGRDIGTVVIPDSPVKVYLDASAEERARRRHAELQGKGVDVAYDAVLADIMRRDAIDSSRELAPLAVAADAALIDTTDSTPDETIQQLVALVRHVERDS